VLSDYASNYSKLATSVACRPSLYM